MIIDNNLLESLLTQAKENPRLRQNYDLRTSSEDKSQRMLNALMPGTQVAIHRHPMSTENVFVLRGKMVEIFYSLTPSPSPNGEGCLVETERILLDPASGNFGCVVPAGVWHTVEVLEPTVMYESKDGKYGEDGSEAMIDRR